MGDFMLVSGDAGFLVTHLCDRLLADGHDVVGVYCITEHYAREQKERNLANARERDSVELVEADLAEYGVEALRDGVDTVLHLAAEPGVRGGNVSTYLQRSVIATRRLLAAGPRRLVYASSSSVSGNAAHQSEDTPA